MGAMVDDTEKLGEGMVMGMGVLTPRSTAPGPPVKLPCSAATDAWCSRDGGVELLWKHCTELYALDLSKNRLTKGIPDEVFGLQKLSKLLLLGTAMSRMLPPSIADCMSLVRLRLDENQFAGEIAREIEGAAEPGVKSMSSSKIYYLMAEGWLLKYSFSKKSSFSCIS
ncbi:hypothetical protein ZWY2020_016861 [Hordeum vulgare]|nr:hypothetical protein ZWY2020_016861 [Hordeum vulgare]